MEGISPEDQIVLLGGTPLEDDAVIGQCGIADLSTLEVAARMLGGKYEDPWQMGRDLLNSLSKFWVGEM